MAYSKDWSLISMQVVCLMLACVVAHLLPFELFLAAYAFLGPAHYLTEISWLHERRYFMNARWPAAALLAGALAMLVWPQYWIFYLGTALAFAVATQFTSSWPVRLGILAISFLAVYLWQHPGGLLTLILVSLLPTVIHVFVFTFIFVLSGWLRHGDNHAPWVLVAMVLAVFSCFVLPASFYVLWPQWTWPNSRYFTGTSAAINPILDLNGERETYVKIFKFLAFAYTYHYLNWFMKTRDFGWLKRPRWQLGSLALIYLFFIGVYIYDYKLGLQALLVLSALHVVLEFPLNVLTIKNLFIASPFSNTLD